MKIFNKFLWSKKEPSNKNDIWFDGSTWKMYTEEAWQSFTLPVDAADKLAKVLENVSEVYQEKLNAGYGIVIDGNTISVDESIKYDDTELKQQLTELSQKIILNYNNNLNQSGQINTLFETKADKAQFEGKSYVETDGISTNDFYYSMPDSADGTEDDIIATKGNLKKINGQDLYGKGNIVIEGKNYDNEIATLQQKDAQTEAKLTELDQRLTVVEENGGGTGGGTSPSFTSVEVSVDDTTGDPRAEAEIDGNTLKIDFFGLKGEQGIQGEKGEKGDTGATGSTGPKGDTGDKGDTGAQGVSISSVTQTTTSSVDNGNNVVTVTLSNGAKSTFTVKNGSKGSQGSQGVQGVQGPKGDTGATGPKGPKGDTGDGVEFSITKVSSTSQMTDITKLYALNGEVYRFEGAEGVNEVAAVAVIASEGGEVPLFTNLYVKEEAEINKRISTSAFKDQTGGLLTNYMDIPMGHGVENPVVRIKGLPHPETFGTHDLDRIVCLKDGAEYKQNGNWVMYYCKEGLNNGYYTKEVLEDGTLVLTMKAGGFPAIWGVESTYTYQPLIAFDNVNNDASALTEAPDLIITLNEEIKYGTPEEPSEPTNKGRWVNTHIKYDADASEMVLDNLAELQGYAEIPAYWETEMVDTIEKVARLKKAAGNAAISFAWCSDAHVMANTSAEGNTTYLGRLLNKAIKDTFTPLAISTGDEMHGAVLASEDKVYENFAEMKKHFYPMWGKKEFIALLGNHDGAYGKNDQGGQTYQKRIQPNELFDVYFKEQMLDFRRVVSTDGTYFYIDTPQKVRFICLNTHYAGESVEVDENGFTNVNVYNNNYLGQQQYDWLINEALKLPSDEWSCIVAGHIAPVLGTNLTIPSGSNPAYNYSSSLKDKEVLAGVLNAFIAKGSYSKSYTDANSVGDVSIDCDFSTYKGSMICYIAGHWHCDKTEDKSLNGIPIILITSAQDDRDSSLPARADSTDQETAFDVVVVNRKTRNIHCVRCGAGEDRTISY